MVTLYSTRVHSHYAYDVSFAGGTASLDLHIRTVEWCDFFHILFKKRSYLLSTATCVVSTCLYIVEYVSDLGLLYFRKYFIGETYCFL